MKKKVVFKDDMVNHIYGIIEMYLDNNSLTLVKLINPNNDSGEEYDAINHHIKESIETLSNHMKNNTKFYKDLVTNLYIESIILIRYKADNQVCIETTSLYSVPVIVRVEVI